MIKGIGVDICDLNRLKNMDQLAKRILHSNEYQLYLSKKTDKLKREFLGGRFAVKEAYVKACGMKDFQLICCLNDENGKPYIENDTCHVSISHENDYVIAFIIAEY
ncbi:MAG: holo-ACP synthase [Faecalibacillus sp.]